jgi:Ca2+/Na+ antiporter
LPVAVPDLRWDALDVIAVRWLFGLGVVCLFASGLSPSIFFAITGLFFLLAMAVYLYARFRTRRDHAAPARRTDPRVP